MRLGDNILDMVDRMLAGAEPGTTPRALIAALRGARPSMVVLHCDAVDMFDEPWRRYKAVDLHLVDTSNHCVAVTADPAAATGVLLAVREMAS